MTTDEQTGELRCSCGYLLQGLTEKRCPECGRPFPGKPHRKKPYLVWGFLVGFSLGAVTIGLTFVVILPETGDCVSDAIRQLLLMLGYATTVVTGLIGMLIGYVVYRSPIAGVPGLEQRRRGRDVDKVQRRQ